MTVYEVTHQDDLVESIEAETPLVAARLAICRRLAVTMEQAPMPDFPGGIYIATVKVEGHIRMFSVDFDACRIGPTGLMEFPFTVREETLE